MKKIFLLAIFALLITTTGFADIAGRNITIGEIVIDNWGGSAAYDKIVRFYAKEGGIYYIKNEGPNGSAIVSALYLARSLGAGVDIKYQNSAEYNII